MTPGGPQTPHVRPLGAPLENHCFFVVCLLVFRTNVDLFDVFSIICSHKPVFRPLGAVSSPRGCFQRVRDGLLHILTIGELRGMSFKQLFEAF